MTCDGHYAHYFEASDECRACQHPRGEHDKDGFWEDDRDKPHNEWAGDTEGYVTVPLDWGGELGHGG